MNFSIMAQRKTTPSRCDLHFMRFVEHNAWPRLFDGSDQAFAQKVNL